MSVEIAANEQDLDGQRKVKMGIIPKGSRHLAKWLAIAGLLVVPLSGCVSGSAQNFASSVSPQDRTASIAAGQEPPLAIASSSSLSAAGVDDGMNGGASTYDEDAIAAMLDRDPKRRRAGNDIPGNDGEKLAYAYETGPQQTQPGQYSQHAVYSGQNNGPVLASVDGQQPGAPGQFLTPADMEAEARIPALYASIDHGQCKGGWGPKPKLVNVKRMNPGDPYYMEMRLRHTPMLPVGHVYIAYGRLGPDGEPLDEKLIMLAPVGGYGGAAFAAAIPMPGVLKPYGDDCIVRPHAAYRVSLSPSRYEKLLLEVQRQKEKKPAYSLFAYNCNHFLSDVAASAGILPPENIYEPSLKYFYAMMDRNEGYKVPRNAKEVAAAEAAKRRQQQQHSVAMAAAIR